MISNYLQLIFAILFPLVGGWSSSKAMGGQVRKPGGKAWYQIIKKPSWTPKNSVFALVWVVLYSTMGYASYVIFVGCEDMDKVKLPLALYGGQLLLNFMWTPIFFGFHWMGLAFLDMLLLDLVTIACTYSFYQISMYAALLMSPYLAWLAFVSCLNFTVWRMNVDAENSKIL